MSPRSIERLEMPVEGMTCASCAHRIERKLNKLEGVEATVNYATERATVELDPERASTEDLLGAVEAAGYRASLPASESPARDEARPAEDDDPTASLRRRLVVAAVLSIPVLLLRPDRRPARTHLGGAPVPPPSAAADEPRGVQARVEPATELLLDSRRALRRADVYRDPVVDGLWVDDGPITRLRVLFARMLETPGEREEAKLETELAALTGGSRSNTIAVISPKGGVGKTTSTFLLGNTLASHLRMRVVAVDANPDFGTLGELAPDSRRVARTLTELVGELDRVHSGSELKPYVSQLPSGLHLLAAPAHAEVMAGMTPDHYGQLLAFLGRYYDAVLLDCGTGITDPLAQFSVSRADQTVIVTTPEWITAQSVLGALRHLELDRATLVLNQAQVQRDGRGAIETHFGAKRIGKRVAIPYDEQLRTMLDSATYSLEALKRPIRLPIKRLTLAVGEQLV